MTAFGLDFAVEVFCRAKLTAQLCAVEYYTVRPGAEALVRPRRSRSLDGLLFDTAFSKLSRTTHDQVHVLPRG